MSDYAVARKVLLDALQALGSQRVAVVLCGAQAVYLRTGEADFAVSPFTADADLAVRPEILLDIPTLRDAMEGGGFRLTDQPGIWKNTDNVAVDLLVADAQGGTGRRGARLGAAHGNDVARKVKGLEAATVDRGAMKIAALDPADPRVFEVEVAGPSALLVAKLHKIAERVEEPWRLKDKDALDVLRILRAVESADLAAVLQELRHNELAGPVTEEALAHLETLFAANSSAGSQMAVRATEGLEDPDYIAAACASLAQELLRHPLLSRET